MKIRSKTEMSSPEYLRKRFRYEPETGKLYWRHYDGRPTNWNTRWAGKEAGTLHLGYVLVNVDHNGILAHRVIWAMVNNEWPDEEIDHINHMKADNRLENLRLVDRFLNTRNTTFNRNNTSGYRGVVWHGRDQHWRAQIRHQCRQIHLGSFKTKEEAVKVRREAEIRLGFHPNHGAPCGDAGGSGK